MEIEHFYLSRDHNIEESCDFVGGVLSSKVTTLLTLGSIGLMELEIMTLVILVLIPIPIPIPMPRFQCRGLQRLEKLFTGQPPLNALSS